MRLLGLLFLSLISITVFSQEWRDSLMEARKAYNAKDYDKAMRYYQSAQNKNIDGIDLNEEMGQTAYKKRDFEKAEQIYQEANSKLSNEKQQARNHYNTGNSRMKSKNYQGAVDSYKDALRINPDDKEARYNLSKAVKKLKNEQSKKKNQQDKNQDQQNNQKSSQQNQQKQAPKNSNSSKKNQSKQNPNNDGEDGDKKQGTLPNKAVDKMLDDLMKKEAETKRKMTGVKGGGERSISGKDW